MRAVVESALAVVADTAVAVGGATAASVATADTVVKEVVEEGVPDGLGLGSRLVNVVVVVHDGAGRGSVQDDGLGSGSHDVSDDRCGGTGTGGRIRVVRVLGTLVDDNESWAWVAIVASLLVAGAELGLSVKIDGLDTNGAHGCDDCGLEHFNIISKSLRGLVLNTIILTKIS